MWNSCTEQAEEHFLSVTEFVHSIFFLAFLSHPMECTVSFPISICSSFQTLKSLEACYWFWDVSSVFCIFHAVTSCCQEKKKTQKWFQDTFSLPLKKRRMSASHCSVFIILWEYWSWKRITTAIVGIDLCRAGPCLPGRIQPLHTKIESEGYAHLSLGICTAAPNYNSRVCLARCDFICRQCSHWIRSNRFCAGNCTSACHAPLLQQSTAEPSCVIPQLYFLFPSVCHAIVSRIAERLLLLLRCVISLSWAFSFL